MEQLGGAQANAAETSDSQPSDAPTESPSTSGVDSELDITSMLSSAYNLSRDNEAVQDVLAQALQALSDM